MPPQGKHLHLPVPVRESERVHAAPVGHFPELRFCDFRHKYLLYSLMIFYSYSALSFSPSKKLSVYLV